jgi:hypothetical protein
MLFVLKTTSLTFLLAWDHLPQDDDLLFIVLSQAITVHQEPLRLNVLQVLKSGMFVVVSLIWPCCLLSVGVVYFLFRLVP